jgi:lipoprotein-anchoring transpeptidase ErfK/SrfK
MRRIFGRQSPVIAARVILCAASAAMLLQAAPALVSAQEASERPVAAPSEPSAPLGIGSPAPAPAQTASSDPAASPSPAPNHGLSATAILSSVQVTRELDIPHWLRPGEFVWTDQVVPDSGSTVVVVNLRARVVSVYRAGVEIGRSSLIYGADNKPTPIGEFPVLEKDVDHVSNLYDAPMPHMLRLTWDGVALHGSPELRDDLATRGCVGLPRAFAALLYDVVNVGDRVIVWDGVTRA